MRILLKCNTQKFSNSLEEESNLKNQFEKLWTVPFGKVSVSFVYSFSFDAIFSFNPKRLHSFFDR